MRVNEANLGGCFGRGSSFANDGGVCGWAWKEKPCIKILDLDNASACTVLRNPTDSILLWVASALEFSSTNYYLTISIDHKSTASVRTENPGGKSEFIPNFEMTISP
jgi:hypothetical protein